MREAATNGELVMDNEVRARFDKIDRHLERQDVDIHKHAVDDAEIHARINLHLEDSKAKVKFKIALWIALFGAAGTIIFDWIAKHVMKG